MDFTKVAVIDDVRRETFGLAEFKTGQRLLRLASYERWFEAIGLPNLGEPKLFQRFREIKVEKYFLSQNGTWHYFIPFANMSTADVSEISEETSSFHSDRLFFMEKIFENIKNLSNTDKLPINILDIGSNNGLFSLLAALAFPGAYVTGVDLRKQNIAQAEFLKHLLKIENAQFVEENVKNIGSSDSYEIVLLLGLMYHLTTPIETLRAAWELTNHCLIVDSNVHPEPFPGFFITRKNIDSVLEGDDALELQPTYRGFALMIEELKPRLVFECLFNTSKSHMLRSGMRRMFVLFK